MVYIQKGKEPASLTAYKKQQYAYFDGCNKEDIRKKLLIEQGYLCAYCMRRIDNGHMKIEHWYPETLLSEQEKLNYENMLGVCMGHIDGQKGRDDTCDAHKGEDKITVDPRDERTLAGIKYRSKSGEIYADDKEIANDLEKTLNLNSTGHQLARNRKAKLDAVLTEVHRKWPKGNWSKEKMQKFIEAYSLPDKNGEKREYLGVVQWYFNKKIQR